MIFISLALISLFLGGMTALYSGRWLMLSILFLMLAPTSTGMAQFNTLSGLFFYDFYFLSLVLVYLISPHQTAYIGRDGSSYYELNKLWIYFLLLLSVYLLYAGISLVANGGTKYLLRDLRPLIVTAEFSLSYWILSRDKFLEKKLPSKIFINSILPFVFLSSILKLIIVQLNVELIDDQFYVDNSYRYLDATTYVAVFFVNYYFFCKSTASKKDFTSILCLISAIVCILVSNSRVLILGLILGLALATVSKYGFRKFARIAASALLLLGAFFAASYYVESGRVIDALDQDVLIFQLVNRFSPFIDKFQSFNYIELLFGEGFGVPFYIPWFEYRDTVDVFNSNIDSYYLTMYAKFGLISFAVIWLQMKLTLRIVNITNRVSLNLFMAVIFFVSATYYQIYSVGLYVGCVLVAILRLYESE